MKTMLFRKVFVPGLALMALGNVDPVTAEVDTRDAERFATLFTQTNGHPTAAQLQREYIDGAGVGLQKFIPYRIENSDNLAKAINAEPKRYAYAIKTCLPLVKGLTSDMRAIYLAYKELLPDRALPPVYMVFGANNSGGTAQADAQILGLEVHCGPGITPDKFKTIMREMFAHETVHSWQGQPNAKAMEDPLLLYVLREGVPDYLASLVTRQVQKADLNAWATSQHDMLFTEFAKDRAIVKAGSKPDGSMDDKARAALGRWLYNYGHPPDGWQSDAGYWLGAQIAKAYADKATDKNVAIRELIDLDDPETVFATSGYSR
jgi:hypothetical protein